METGDHAALATQAEFARLHGVSRKTVTVWKGEGRLIMVGDKISVEASVARLRESGRLLGQPRDIAPKADPFAFAASIVDPSQRLSVIRAVTVVYDAPAVAALCAFEIGIPILECWRLYRQMRVSMIESTFDKLAAWGCEPLASDSDAPIVYPDAFEEPIWQAMAAERGESFLPPRR